jgi:hypothetical protein
MAPMIKAIAPNPNVASCGVVFTLARKLNVKMPSDQMPKTFFGFTRCPSLTGLATI